MYEQNEKISAGEVIVLTQGEYSDFGIKGYIVATVDFNIKEAIEEFNPTLDEDDWDKHTKFLAWLIHTEKAVPVKHREIHIGSYSVLEV